MSLLVRQLAHIHPRFTTTPGVYHAKRALSLTRECRNEQVEQTRNVQDFPWLLSTDSPRIQEYPYSVAARSWFLLGWLPKTAQYGISRWLGDRLLQLNTGQSYFPEEFLEGAKSACQPVLQLLSRHLSHPTDETRQTLETMVGKQLLDRYSEAAHKNFDDGVAVSIDIRKIHGVHLNDIWVSLGNPQAFSNNKQYQVMEWMTLRLGAKRSIFGDSETSFSDYRKHLARALLEGLLVDVDVGVDADIVYKISKDDDTLIYDEGRRILSLKFETPHFEPADRIISGRDKDTGEPINDWTWRLADIDHLLLKDQIDKDLKKTEE